ncbi:alpha-(1-_3)-arabinofuranosyltransferase [Marihabitans asiaticum]|uniref:Arabinofuranan 3-O-arabinosyltransferase n=1 Tax=Marihabitans asiaticum TaxID=415218 RepID=A0A560WAT2_9MICO|nr:alpha-(1->3)-arabinofuranosyltransferase family protein [Marihabitans asiaticum]TWD14741.1 arabinofuranan 3-O-arabinosyltransferase [Marihabitans asiaticum]
MSGDHSGEPESRITRWLRALGPSAFLIAFALVQQPGRIAGDTKLDLVVDPVGYLSRALQLWDSTGAAGQLQNQAYGYLWPMGPFFAVFDLVGVPAWVTQRLWWALILLVAFHGMRLLLKRLSIGTEGSRLLGALAYALAPRMLLGLGAVSSEIWPMAVAPWVLIPLVAVGPGELWTAALRSAAAVLMTGAVNAVATGAVLVLPVLWILTRERWRLALLWRWAVAVAAVSLWWVGPLLLLGRYSPPFLSWIEAAEVSTSLASATEALRGTTQWLATIGWPQNSLWPAGPIVLGATPLVALGLVLVLLGLAGLVTAPSTWGGFARVGLLAGLVLVMLGSTTGALPWAPIAAAQPLLDGALAPLRNAHKFEPVIRIPLVMGLTHAVPVLARWGARRRWWRPALVPTVAAAAVVAMGAGPALVGVVQRGSFVEVPDYWQEAADYLEATDDGGRALVVPGATFPASYWGNSRDEPLQPLAMTPWMVRNAVPLGSAGATRLLNDIEARIASGYGGEELGRLFERTGITRVLLRADLDYSASGAPEPQVTDAALRSAGLRRVKSIGPEVGLSASATLRPFVGEEAALPAIGIYELPGSSGVVPPTARAKPLVVVGGPEAVALTATKRPMVLASDTRSVTETVETDSSVILTDTLQRREANFAAVRSLYGPLLAEDEPYRANRADHDWLMPWLPADGGDAQTAALLSGAESVRASSSLTMPAFGQKGDPSALPESAFDGSGDTAWRSAGEDPVGQWIEVQWEDQVDLGLTIPVTFDMDEGASVAEVRVETDAGSARTPITPPGFASDPPARYTVDVAVPAGSSSRFRLRVTDVHDERPTVSIRDIGAGSLPRVETWARVPGPVPGQLAGTHLQTSIDRAYACITDRAGIVRCRDGSDRRAPDETDLRREIELAGESTVAITGTLIPRPASDRLLARLDGLDVSASSTFHSPQTAAELGVDGDPSTYWAPRPEADGDPWIELSWPDRRPVTELALQTDPAVGGRRPTKVRIQSDGRSDVERAVSADGTVTIPEVRTSRIRVTVLEAESTRPQLLLPSDEPPVVIGEVEVVDAPRSALDGAQKVGLKCGFGPSLQVDGEEVQTRVTGTREQLRLGRPMSLTACGDVSLSVGTHRIRVLASPAFAPRTLTLASDALAEPESAPVEPTRWTSTSRSVEVGERAEAVVLQVRENANPGWVATSGGEVLSPITVDGWSQGWVLPAGGATSVDLEFRPQRVYFALIVGGLVLAGMVLALAVVSRRKSTTVPTTVGTPARRWSSIAIPSAALFFLGGPLGLLGLGLVRLPERCRPAVLLAVLATVWVVWSAASPWPSGLETNRDVVSQLLALTVVGAAVSAPQARARGRSGS